MLGRGTPGFGELLAGHLLVNMASTAPAYSCGLEADIRAAGGRYVEAPVSGSRKPAEAGQLVALLGGDVQTVEEIRPLLGPMCRETVMCGPAGNGALMKLSVNLLLNTMIASLAEAVHFADRSGLDLRQFQAAIDAGAMANGVTRVKLPKLIERDFDAQAAMADALNSCRLIAEVAREARVASPLLDLARELYGEAVSMGHGRLDMAGVTPSRPAQRPRSNAMKQIQKVLSLIKRRARKNNPIALSRFVLANEHGTKSGLFGLMSGLVVVTVAAGRDGPDPALPRR